MTQNRYRKGKTPKKRTTAAILALVFGVFGVHKFYLNRSGAGIFYIFMFIISSSWNFPISTILGFIDAIKLFTMSDEEFHRKYNRGAWVNPQNEYETRRHRERKQRKTSAPASRRTTKRSNPFKKNGLKKYKAFDLEGAIEDFKKAIDRNQKDADLHFYIANAYSLTEQKENAYKHLAKAVELGFKNVDIFSAKDDLAFVRIQPEWEDFKERGFKMTTNMFADDISASQYDTDDVLLSQLNQLTELRNRGLLTEQEFSLERKKLLQQR